MCTSNAHACTGEKREHEDDDAASTKKMREETEDVIEDMRGFAKPSSTLDRMIHVGIHDGPGDPEAHYETFGETMDELCNMYTPNKCPVRVNREFVQHLCTFAFSGRLPAGLRQSFEDKCYKYFDKQTENTYIMFTDAAELNMFLSMFGHIAESVAIDFRLAYHWHWFVRVIEYGIRENNRAFDTLSIEEKRALFRGLYEQARRENAEPTFETKEEWDDCVGRFDFGKYTAANVARAFAYGMNYECHDDEDLDLEDAVSLLNPVPTTPPR